MADSLAPMREMNQKVVGGRPLLLLSLFPRSPAQENAAAPPAAAEGAGAPAGALRQSSGLVTDVVTDDEVGGCVALGERPLS